MKDREEYDEEQTDKDTKSVVITFVLFLIFVLSLIGGVLWWLLTIAFN